jgi:hypothetical protein
MGSSLVDYTTSNLLLAAFLECGGGTIVHIESRKRYSIIHLNLAYLSKDILVNKSNRLSRVIDRLEDPSEWSHLFNGCILGEVEDKYLRLKRRIVDERSKNEHRGAN